jgi:hypothetical protein
MNTFSPGETIRGKITIENTKALPKITEIEIILGAREFAQAKMKMKRIEIYLKYEHMIKRNEGNNSSIIQFGTHIPKEITPSYLGNILNITTCLK